MGKADETIAQPAPTQAGHGDLDAPVTQQTSGNAAPDPAHPGPDARPAAADETTQLSTDETTQLSPAAADEPAPPTMPGSKPDDPAVPKPASGTQPMQRAAPRAQPHARPHTDWEVSDRGPGALARLVAVIVTIGLGWALALAALVWLIVALAT